MKLSWLFPLGLLLASGAPASAGPCTADITALQTRYDQRLDAAAANGPAATETTGAKLHHQPTQQSISQAETRLGDLPPGASQAFSEAMMRARAADDANDEAGCKTAVADASGILKP